MQNKKKIFSQLYDQFVEKIYRFIFLKVNSKELAQDFTSETFLKTWLVFQNQEILNIKSFLYTTAKNLVIDYYRQRNKATCELKNEEMIVDHNQNLEKTIILNAEIEQLRIVLATLKEEYQDVIIWYYLDELPVPEIAKLLDKTESANRVLIHRSLKVLREKLEQNQK